MNKETKDTIKLIDNSNMLDVKKDLKTGAVVITKDNIHLHYKFMSDDDLELNREIIQQTLFTRLDKIKEECKISNLWNFNEYEVLKRSTSLMVLSMSIFGIKDTLKPIDEYIENMKNSSEYKEYILNSDLSLFKKVKSLNIPFDAHCSDLYLYANEDTKKLLDMYEFKSNITTFISQTDNKIMFDIPFAYEDYKR